MFTPDERNDSLVNYNFSSNSFEKASIEIHYENISRIMLNDDVPEGIKSGFSTSQNLLLYSWYVYPFIVIAELNAIACLEFALKTRIMSEDILCNVKVMGLRKSMLYAIEKGWLQDEGVADIIKTDDGAKAYYEFAGLIREEVVPESDPQAYIKILADALPKIRNELAHGTPMLWPGGYGTLRLVARLINQLWRYPVGA